MAKSAGWYPDPWGGGGHRWWNGSGWTENELPAGVPVPTNLAPGASETMLRSGALYEARNSRPWYELWPVIGVLLVFCCLPGLILTWTRSNTPAIVKIAVSGAWFLANLLIGLLLVKLGLYRPGA